jgi:predicted small metal-binding protein
MSMRVVECNICGDVLAAANDEELLDRLRGHMELEHAGEPFDEQRARDQLAIEAYTAGDS